MCINHRQTSTECRKDLFTSTPTPYESELLKDINSTIQKAQTGTSAQKQAFYSMLKGSDMPAVPPLRLRDTQKLSTAHVPGRPAGLIGGNQLTASTIG